MRAIFEIFHVHSILIYPTFLHVHVSYFHFPTAHDEATSHGRRLLLLQLFCKLFNTSIVLVT